MQARSFVPLFFNSIVHEGLIFIELIVSMSQVECEFEYYKKEMTADVQLLIFSKGNHCTCWFGYTFSTIFIKFLKSCVKRNTWSLEMVLGYKQIFATFHWIRNAAGTCEIYSPNFFLTNFLKNSVEVKTLWQDGNTSQVVENDLVAARQTNRSLNNQDLSRFNNHKLWMWYYCQTINVFKHQCWYFCFVEHQRMWHWQIGDNGALDVCKFWGNNFDSRTMTDGKGIGKAENGETKVNLLASQLLYQMLT